MVAAIIGGIFLVLEILCGDYFTRNIFEIRNSKSAKERRKMPRKGAQLPTSWGRNSDPVSRTSTPHLDDGFEISGGVRLMRARKRKGKKRRTKNGTWLLIQAAGAAKLVPATQEVEIHAEDDVTKVQKDSADIMKESRSVRKCDASRISLVKMSLGLMAPGM
jgi:hypothetical protein